jgi:hypothetical protein
MTIGLYPTGYVCPHDCHRQQAEQLNAYNSVLSTGVRTYSAMLLIFTAAYFLKDIFKRREEREDISS